MKKCEINIEGMTCSACAVHVEDAVKKLEGVDSVRVSLLTNKAQIVYDETRTNEHHFCDAVKKAGYRPITPSEAAAGGTGLPSGKSASDSDRETRMRLILSAVFLVPLFLLDMGLMAAHRFAPGSAVAAFHGTLLSALTQFLLLIPILFLNRSYFTGGFKTLFRGKPIMDSLIAVGAGAAVAYSLFALYRLGYGLETGNQTLVKQYGTHLYFESAGMILTLVSLGKYLESRARRRTSSVIEKLIDLSPRSVTVIRNGREETIPTDSLLKDEIFLIKAGETAAADGTVIEGSSAMDESALTGESIPVEKNPDDSVLAGSVNRWGLLKVRATRVGKENTLARIISLVEEASASKAPIARLADRISRVFVPVVMTIALVTFAAALFFGLGFETALGRAIAVLVISCPCALGLATPTAVTVGIGRGAELGILIRNGEALEKAGRIDFLLLDKTGTLTEGRPSVTAVRPSPGVTKDELIKTAAALEAGSSHPLADAVTAYAAALNINYPPAGNLQTVPGRGICGTVSGKTVYAGNASFLTENGITVPAGAGDAVSGGETPLFFAENGRFLGTLSVIDRPKPDSAEAVAGLKEMGITPVMLTGDRAETAAAVGALVGIETVRADLLPQDKEAEIRRLQNEGHSVGMTGDGINDSPALARADIGIAPANGSDIAIETAEIILMNNCLSDAVTALRLSRKVMHNIKENLFWALFYNCLGIPAASGLLEALFGIPLRPEFAAAAMSLSSICVVGNALRLKRFRSRFSRDAIIGKNKNQGGFPMKTVELKIEGMMCSHCRTHVESALNAVEGVSATVDLQTAKATCRIENNTAVDVLKKAVTGAGYTVTDIIEK